jgi:hypothetical protein
MLQKTYPTQEVLQQQFDYHPDGYFIRKTTGQRTEQGFKTSYARVFINGDEYLVHRCIYIYHHGDIQEKGLYIDHIDCEKTNNRIQNLRLVTPKENDQNQFKSREIQSDFQKHQWQNGVFYIPSLKLWQCQYFPKDIRYSHVQLFESELQALKAYQEIQK